MQEPAGDETHDEVVPANTNRKTGALKHRIIGEDDKTHLESN